MNTTRPTFILARSVASMLALSSTVFAADWNGSVSTDWNDPANWTGGVPAGQNAIIGILSGSNPPFTATITADVPQMADFLVARGGGPAIVNHTAGIAATGNDQWMDVGTDGGTGTYNLGIPGGSGALTGLDLGSGTIRVGGGNGGAGRLYVGGVDFSGAGGTGIFNVNTSGTLQIDNDLAIGTGGGTGTMNVDAGTITTGGWNFIGKPDNGNGAANGTLKMAGGSLTNGGGRTYVGMGNTVGRIELSGTGTYSNIGDWFAVGHDNLANATPSSIDMTGSSVLNTSLLAVGGSPDNPGKGTLTASGTTQLNLGELWVGNRVGSDGVMTVSGGTVAVGGWFAVGRDGSTGSVTLNGNTVLNQGASDAGTMFELTNFGVGGTATVNLNGTSVLMVNGVVHNGGGGGISTINFNGGTLKARRDNGTFMQGITNVLLQAGGATFDSNGFAVTIGQSLTDGAGGGVTKVGTGSVTLSGANSYTGVTAANGGNLIISGDNFVGAGATVGASGTLTFGAGGTTGMLNGNVAIAAGGALNFNRSDDLAYAFDISGAGTVNKNGANALTIGGSAAGFTGTTNVNNGALILNNPQGGTVAVNSGARLVPIASLVGTLDVGALSLNTNATADFEFLGASSDKINVTGGAGSLNFGSSFTLNFYDENALTPFATDGIYTLFDYNTSFTGNLSNLVVGNPVSGKGYALSDDAGTTSIRLTISTVTLSEWTNTGGGLWTEGTNWTAGSPSAPSAEAIFGLLGIQAPSAVDMNGNKTVGKLTFNNFNAYTINGAGTLTLDNGATASTISVMDGSHTIAVPITATGNLSITTAAGTGIELGAISGGNAVTTGGAGTVTLAGAGAYSTTTVNGGNLNVGNGGATGSLGSGAVFIGTGASVSFNRSDSITVGNSISGLGSLIQNGSGTLTYNGTANHTGATTLNSGAFVNAGTISGTSSLFIQNTATFQAGSTAAVAGPIDITNSSTVTVDAGGTLTSTGNTNITNGSTVTTSGTFGAVGAGDMAINSGGTLFINGGTTSSEEAYIGNNGSAGVVNMSAGTWTTNRWTVLGDGGGTSGTVNMTGGTWNQNHTDWLSVGQTGYGEFNMSGDSRLNDQAVVDTSTRGTNKGNVVVGRWSGAGIGKWNLTDTASARVRALIVGDQAGTDGEVNVGDSSSIVSQDFDLFVGLTGTGRVNMNGGSATFNQGWTFIGQNAGGNGTLNVNAGSLSSLRFYVGQSGTGAINVAGGTLTANDTVLLGENATGRGTVSVSGGNFNVTANGLLVSDGGLGVLNVSGTGAMSVNGTAVVGNGAASTGHVSVTGGSLNVNGELWVGQRRDEVSPAVFVTGKGLMDVSAGSVSANNWLAVGRDGALGVLNVRGTGTVTKNGGNGNHIIIGSIGGTGTANIIGGTLMTNGGGDVRLGEPGGSGPGSGVLNIASGGIVHADAILDGPGGGAPNQVYLNGGTIRAAISNANFMSGLDNAIVGPVGATIDTNGNNITIAQSLDAPTGVGVITIPILDGGSGYAGQPIVEITGDGFGASAVANLTGDVITSITITNPGIGYTTASVTLHGGGETIAATLDVPTLGANVATGGLTKTGDGTLTLTTDGTYGGATTVTGGTLEYTVSQTMSSLVIGAGATVVLADVGPSPAFGEAPVLADIGPSGISSQVSSVPEPGALGLLAAGVLGLSGRRRRTRNS